MNQKSILRSSSFRSQNKDLIHSDEKEGQEEAEENFGGECITYISSNNIQESASSESASSSSSSPSESKPTLRNLAISFGPVEIHEFEVDDYDNYRQRRRRLMSERKRKCRAWRSFALPTTAILLGMVIMKKRR